MMDELTVNTSKCMGMVCLFSRHLFYPKQAGVLANAVLL